MIARYMIVITKRGTIFGTKAAQESIKGRTMISVYSKGIENIKATSMIKIMTIYKVAINDPETFVVMPLSTCPIVSLSLKKNIIFNPSRTYMK